MLAFSKQGSSYVATEGCSMLMGAAAFLFYGFAVCQFMMRLRASAPLATTTMLALWLAVALGLKEILIG